MPSITRIASFQDFLAVLVEAQVPHQIDPEALVAEIQLPGGNLFVRWEKTLPYAQIIQPMVRDVPAARLAEVEHAICRANNFVPVPGFGFEYQRGFIYMRLCVPMYAEGMLVQSFNRQMKAVVQNAKEFTSAFKKVVEGAPGEQLVPLAIADNKGPA
jgi:hypothetical protein